MSFLLSPGNIAQNPVYLQACSYNQETEQMFENWDSPELFKQQRTVIQSEYKFSQNALGVT